MDPVVELHSGLVRGLVVEHDDGFLYYSFRKIPYAEPPIGELRFKDPVPIKRWTGVIECKDYGPVCLQYDIFSKVISYSEDCLHLNVFTRSINDKAVKSPVMVVIHGGGFVFGSGNDFLYGPDYLIRKDLVLVTFNYRLGILGFLNLEDEIAPGNQGMKDQVLVLKWVQQNIRSFGGDPGNVTVFGVSAGAASAHYVALSPLAKGLVHKIIVQGCTLYNPWIYFSQGKTRATKYCSLLGRRLTDSEQIVKFLRSVDTKRLQETQEYFRIILGTVPFGPGIDDKSPNPFMPLHPRVAADKGVHIPCLIGYTNREGLLLLAAISRKDCFRIWDLNFSNILKLNTRTVADQYSLTPQQIRRLYYKDEAVSEDNLENYVDFCSDFYFIEGIHKFLRVHAERSSAPAYLYQFSYEHPTSFSSIFLKDKLPGVCHLDDVIYLFKCGAFDMLGIEHFKRDTKQYRLMEQMTEMWANFAKYGKPTIEKSKLTPTHWQPIADGTLLRYLNLDIDITMQSTLNVDQKLLAARDAKN